MHEVDRHFGIESCVERNTESYIRARLYGRVELKKKLSYKRIEFGLGVVKETCDPFSHRPVVVARFSANEERALDLCKDAGDGDVAVLVEESCVFVHVVCRTVEIFAEFLAVVKIAFVSSERYRADLAADRKVDVFCVNFSRTDSHARTVVDVAVNTDGFAVVIFGKICPCDFNPCSDVRNVHSEKLIHDLRNTVGNLDLERVRSESCDDAQSKSFLSVSRRVACRQSISRAVYVDRGVFCKQGQDDFVKIDVRLDFTETEVACVDIERTARVVNTEKNGAFVVEFLARKLDHQLTDVVFGVDACSAEQIVHDRRKVELSCKAQLVV